MAGSGTLSELLETSADRTPDGIAGYKVPERIFVLAELPRRGTGKLDRHALETQVPTDLHS